MNYSKISELFGGDAPYGVDLRTSDDLIERYREIKDLRSAARSEDRSAENTYVSEDGGESPSGTVQQPSAKWRDVADACVEELGTRTKDIELASWLAEAAIRVDGLAGLASTFSGLTSMVQSGLESLHPPLAEDDPADRVTALAGLNGSQDSDGTLLRPLHLASLVPNRAYGRYCLWDWEQAKKNSDTTVLAEIQEAFASLSADEFTEARDAARSCLTDVETLDAKLTEAMGADAPSFRRLRDVLEDINRRYEEASLYVQLPVEEEAAEPAGADAETQPCKAAAPAATGIIKDREQAFQSMLQVAAFFRKTEPHSAIPMALETLVRRGRMDFIDLLTELVPDEHQRQSVLIRAGIEPATTIDVQSETGLDG